MAVRIIHLTTDDLDGSEGAETIEFGMDGVRYEIDLGEVNAKVLREMMAPYVEAGRLAGAQPKAPAGERNDRAELRRVREWARQNGHKIGSKGRVPRYIWDAYRAAA
jgi:hypothetical protein